MDQLSKNFASSTGLKGEYFTLLAFAIGNCKNSVSQSDTNEMFAEGKFQSLAMLDMLIQNISDKRIDEEQLGGIFRVL